MKAKAYLMEYRRKTEELRQLEEELEKLRTMAESITCPTDAESIKAGITDKVGNLASRIVDMTLETIDTRTDIIELQREIINQISELEQWQYSHVLYSRYIECKRWETIADRMGYSFRSVLRIHGEALQEFDKILNK